AYSDVNKNLSGKKLFAFKFQYARLYDFMACYMNEPGEMIRSFGNQLLFTAMDLDIEKDKLTLRGYSNVNDTVSSYIAALQKVKPGKFSAASVITSESAVYLSLSFDSFDDFLANIESQYSVEEGEDYESYSKQIQKFEKLLKINLRDDFFSWIGNEIAFVMTRPTGSHDGNEYAIAIHSKSIEKAQGGLDRIAQQLKKRSPVKFRTVTHLGYPIRFLDMKGFFRVFLGKLFGQIEKPWYTMLNDFVVFSNSPESLMQIIEDFEKGKVLANDKRFAEFVTLFNSEANLSVFVKMPVMYSYLTYFGDKETQVGLKENKDVVLSFHQVGFQLVSNGKLFDTRMAASHEEDPKQLRELENISKLEDEIRNLWFENHGFAIRFEEDEIPDDGNYQDMTPDDIVLVEGNISEGKQDGEWKYFYNNGMVKGVVTFSEGIPVGKLTFYYNTGEVLAELEYDDEGNIDEEYREFYTSGSKKAVIRYRRGKTDGKALYYYDNGSVKIEGEFNKGLKDDVWRYYTKDGQVFDKKKYRNGEEK
ncbi:MAG: DUF3352 domain-containing protein, partial [Bacteroidetes bacterium]|nr:DUF3352 domain-containing protein [Bacteroidota bacterium]